MNWNSSSQLQIQFSKYLIFLIFNLLLVQAYSFSNEQLNYIRPSLFPIFPPYINFPNLNNPQVIPDEIRKSLLWPTAWKNPGILFEAVGNSAGLTILSPTESCFTRHGNETILGTHRTVRLCTVIKGGFKKYMKIKGIPGMRTGFGDKYKLSFLLNDLKKQFPFHNFKSILPSFSIPDELKMFKKAWEQTMRSGNKFWVSKVPQSDSSMGVKLISHWNQIKSKKKRVIQKYLDNPFLFNNRKIELRVLILITRIRPLRIYTFPKLDAMKWPLANYTRDGSRCASIRDLINCKDNDHFMSQNEFAELKDQAFEAIENAGGNGSIARIMDTIYSAVIQILLFWESKLPKHRTNNPMFYQYLAADWFIDDNFNPVLIEINKSPMLNGKWLNFFNTFPEMFNIIGYNFPPTISSKGVKILEQHLHSKFNNTYNYPINQPVTWYNYLPKFRKTKQDILKKKLVTETKTIEENILNNLTPYELYLLASSEDELSKVNYAKRIYPFENMKQYFPIINSDDIYYYKLLDAWERKYGSRRNQGRDLLKSLMRRKFEGSAYFNTNLPLL